MGSAPSNGERRAASRLVVLPSALVDAPVGRLQPPLAVAPPERPLALVHVAVGVAHAAAAVAPILGKLSRVQRAVGGV